MVFRASSVMRLLFRPNCSSGSIFPVRDARIGNLERGDACNFAGRETVLVGFRKDEQAAQLGQLPQRGQSRIP